MSGPGPLPCWVDGRVVPRAVATVPADSSAVVGGLGHYSTALVRAGRVRWLDRHVERLRADARQLGLPPVDEPAVRAAFRELAAAAFGDGDGAIRLQHSVDAAGRSHWLGFPRPLGDEPEAWRCVRAPVIHEGPRPWSGVKTTNTLAYALGARAARAAGAQDALFPDAAGRLLEGGRCNLFVVLADGRWVTPDLACGGVAGLARAVVLERSHSFAVRHVPFEALRSAREIVATNALRGGRAVVALDGEPVGRADGPALAHVAACLAAEGE